MKLFFSLTVISLLVSINCQSSTTGPVACQNKYGRPLNGVCKPVDDCTGAALQGNCANAKHTCCINDKPLTIAANPIISKNLFLKVAGNTPRNNALYNYFVQAMQLASINNNFKAAAFLATLIGETKNFKLIESENAEKPNNQGNNGSEDANTYRGRGAILLRGRDNYQIASKNIKGLGVDLIQNPEQAAFPSVAFKVGAWIWSENSYIITGDRLAVKGNLGSLADGTFHNFTLLTYSLTDNVESLKDRAEINDVLLSELKYQSMKRGQGIECEIGSKKGYAVPICMGDFKKPYCGCEGEYQKIGCPYGYTSNDVCRNSPIIKCCVERCKSSLDLAILMDSSGSIGADDFKKEVNFVKQLVSNLEVGENDTRVSIVNFNSRPTILVDFLNFKDNVTIFNALNQIIYNGGGTATHEALRVTNEKVLQEVYGMRPIEKGVSKVVLVITDGASDNNALTIREAEKIKSRGINIISVGVGSGIRLQELIDMASSINDQYFVNDFNSIFLILSGLSKSTCQQPAQIIDETQVVSKCEKNSYKYFKFSLLKPNNRDDSDEDPFYKEFTIGLKPLTGRTELFFSFEEENPKSSEDFINDLKPGSGQNFIEKVFRFSKREVETKSTKEKLYQISRPTDGQNQVLYFSIKGYDEENEFEVYVYNRTIFNSFKPLKASVSVIFYLISIFFASFFFNIF